MPELRPFLGQGAVDREPGRIDDGLGLISVDRADGVDDRAARPHSLGSSTEQPELQDRQRLGAPAEIGPAVQDTEARAGGVDERTVEAVELRGQLTAVRDDDADVARAEPAHTGFELTGP